ncbi:hypothetical protein R9C00_13480 [Flammeovirgaceae bacterium SG7u.111]|nr:hypothetical protein [Flammeovirgaceae bacterium SG7u.132]WPO38469.1 hypothetical protein R9C00_13480 [Flammeovirgaceae bacterium SG7u.111]
MMRKNKWLWLVLISLPFLLILKKMFYNDNLEISLEDITHRELFFYELPSEVQDAYKKSPSDVIINLETAFEIDVKQTAIPGLCSGKVYYYINECKFYMKSYKSKFNSPIVYFNKRLYFPTVYDPTLRPGEKYATIDLSGYECIQ